jgi:hypothetical protein
MKQIATFLVPPPEAHAVACKNSSPVAVRA